MATKKTTGRQKKAEKSSHGIGTALGITAALAAASAAGYFFYGPEGNKNRKQARAWALKAKAEVLGNIENLREVSEEKYQMLVDKAVARYGKKAGVTEADLSALSGELKKYWKNISASVTGPQKKKKVSRKKKEAPLSASKK